MSSAARFLLEFEATGDQEVVNKIKAVGAAGKQTATDLESLRGIEDPFEPIATGADAAVAPIEGVGTAAEGAVTPLGELGTAAEEGVTSLTDIGSAADTAVTPIEGVGTATEGLGGIFSGAGTEVDTFSGSLDAIGTSGETAAGGLDDANTVVGDFGGAASTSAGQTDSLGDSMGTIVGTAATVGGAIGTIISSLFRYQDAQLKVEKSQNALARAQEAYRKTTEGIQTLLGTATSNIDGIAKANDRYVAAQAEVNRLLGEGITSGEEYNAANAELQASQAALAAEFAKGGGDVKKLTADMNKAEIQAGKFATQQKTVDKNVRQANQALLEQVTGYVTLGGGLLQTFSSLGKVGTAFKTMSGAMKAVPYVAVAGGLKGLAASIGGVLVPALGAAYAGFIAFATVPTLIKSLTAQVRGDLKTTAQEALNMFNILKGLSTIDLGPLGKIALPFTEVFQAIVPHLENYVKGLSDVKGANVETGGSMLDIEKTTKGALDRWNELINPTKAAGTAIEGVSGAAKTNVSAVIQMNNAVNQAGVDMQKSTSLSDEMSAALNNVTGNAIEANKAAAQTAAAINLLSDADIENINALHEHARAQTIANAGYNNAKIAAFQYQAALTTMTQSMVQDTDQKNANAQATLALVNSELNAQNAIATVNEEYANSVDRLADLNTVLGDNEARTKAVATVSNEFAASLKEQSIELEGTLQALQDVENQEQGVANAILQTKVSLEESNQALREAKAVHDDMGASMAKLQTALNDEQTALIEEEGALQASIAAANDSVIMRQRLDNAYLEGVNSIQEWNTELATSVEAEQGAIDALADFGIVFSKLPGYMAPTIENLELVREAALGSGEAMQEMADMASENFQTMAGAANKFIGGMKDTILEGGKDIEDNWKKNWEEIPQAVRDSMSTAQQEEVKAIAEMQAAAEAAVIELGFDLNTEEFAKARSDFTSNLEELAASSDGIWSQMWSRAAELASTGSEAMVARISEIVSSDDSPAIMLQHLEAAAKEFGPIGDSAGTNFVGGLKSSFTGQAVVDQNTLSNMMGSGIASQVGQQVGEKAGTGFGEGFTGNAVLDANTMVNNMGLNELPPKAGTIGKESGITLEQEFAKQLESIVNTINTMQLKPIPFTADVSAVHQALATLTTNPPPMTITVTADVQEAAQQIGSIQNTLRTMVAAPIKITADTSAAISQIDVIKTKLSQLSTDAAGAAITVTANTSGAISAFNAAGKSALTMRNNVNAAANGVKSAVAAAGSAVTSFSSKASSSFAKAGAAGTTMANKVKSASSSMKSSLSSAASSAASFASKCVSSFNKVGSSATSNASKVRNLASAISRLKSKTITITTRYVTSGRPGGLQHGGAFIANNPTTIGGTKVGEHYKPELVTVTPLTNPNNLDRTVTVNTPRTGGGGSREVVIPVTLMLDNKVLIRTVRRGLVEEVSGTM